MYSLKSVVATPTQQGYWLIVVLVPLSRCHLLQTPTRNLLALRPCGTRPSFPCRDPQSHRGGHKPHEGFPDRTSGSDHSEGAFVISTEENTEFNVHNNENDN